MARLIAALTGGILYGLPFVEPRLAPLAFVGMAPTLVVLCRASGAAVLGWSLLGAGAATVLVAMPLAHISWMALTVQAAFILVWPAAALAMFSMLRRRTGWPMGLLWPCCWIVAEWGWSYRSVGQLAFGLSGYTQFVYPRLIQFADVTGVLGVSFLVQATVGSLAEAANAFVSAGAARRGPSLTEKRVLASLGACAACLGVALAYGTVRLAGARPLAGPRLALVQPAVPHTFDAAQQRFVQYRQLGLARARIRSGEADLVVFPENAVMEYVEDSPYLRQFQDLSREVETPLLVGAMGRPDRVRDAAEPEPIRAGDLSAAPTRATNSAVVITDAGIADRYDKIHLLPFSEHLPDEELFASMGLLDGYRRFVASILGYTGAAVPGREIRLLHLRGPDAVPFWSPVCFEQADARLAREAARRGARFFLNITSEGDLGPQVYWNTVAVSVLRAVELRVGVARCGNVGITGVIDPWGRQTTLLRGRRGSLWGEPGVLKARVPLSGDGPTLYARVGDWPAGASSLTLLLAMAVALTRRHRSRQAGPGFHQPRLRPTHTAF
jgi:apolipoprotein N-acyltransferase